LLFVIFCFFLHLDKRRRTAIITLYSGVALLIYPHDAVAHNVAVRRKRNNLKFEYASYDARWLERARARMFSSRTQTQRVKKGNSEILTQDLHLFFFFYFEYLSHTIHLLCVYIYAAAGFYAFPAALYSNHVSGGTSLWLPPRVGFFFIFSRLRILF